MKKFLRYLWKTMKWIFIVFLLFLGSLFFREQRIPKFLVDRITDRYSSEACLIRCDSVSYGIGRGLTLTGLRVYDRGQTNSILPAVSARKMSVRILSRAVHVVGLRYPRLPSSYYVEGECRERNTPITARFPDLGRFELKLDDAEILGIAPRSVRAMVEVSPTLLTVSDIHLVWPDLRRLMSVDGNLKVDLLGQRLRSEIRGLATQPQIRPLLVCLDVPSSYRYFDAFTDVTDPIPAHGIFESDLRNGDFWMKLGLKLGACKYNGVPFERADGLLELYVYTRGTNCNARFGVTLADAVDRDGRHLAGKLGVNLSNEVSRLSYDVKSSIRLKDALDVADFFNDGTLDFIVCDSAPTIEVKGTSGTSVADKGHNDISFKASLGCGSVYGFQVRDLKADFALKGDTLDFSEVTARGKDGGMLRLTDHLEIPDFDGDRLAFHPKISYTGGSLDELADILKFDLGERDGRVDAAWEMSGVASTNILETLNGRGKIRVSEGHLAQMKLFAGLTTVVAEKVPGVDAIVTQSDASCDFIVSNGVFRSDNIYIEGGLVSLKAWGAYDIPKDRLDFTSRIQFLRNESLMGKLLHPITWPFTKLLLEFKTKGPLDDADWEYISIIDRIL